MLDWVVLPLVLWVAGAAALSDWRTGRIPNRLVVLGLLFGVEWTVALGAWLLLGGPGLSGPMRLYGTWGYLGALYLDGAVAFVVGLVLWWVGVWAAGDAKLFAVLAFLMPLGAYSDDLVAGFPSFVLFFNTFVCLMAVLLAELVVKLVVRGLRPGGPRAAAALLRRAAAGVSAQGWGLLRLVLGFVAMFLTIRVLRHFTREALGAAVTLNQTLVYVVLFVLFTPLARLFARRAVFVGACVAIVLYAVWAFALSEDPDARAALVQIGWMSLSIVALGWLYEAYTGFAEVRRVPVRSLAPGQLLSAPFERSLRENSRFNNERMGPQGPDGLTPPQVETLRTWYARNDPAGEEAPVEIATTVPFAPAMLAAVIATWLARGYLFTLG